jgi:phosphorylcholine metabolism protein LicD
MINIKDNLGELEEIINIFEVNGISIIADYGTLLGCIRDNGPIPWDKDVDFSVLCDPKIKNKLKKVFKELIDRGFNIFNKQNPENRFTINHHQALNKRAVIYKSIYVDIFFWWIDGDVWKRKSYLRSDELNKKGKLIMNDWVGSINHKKFDTITLPCPEKSDELLTHRYGDWKKETKYK